MSAILIVEDEPVLRGELRRLLVHHGHVVLEAGSVNEALAELAVTQLDLVLTDLRLPGGPGTDLIGHPSGVPVLVMTSYATVRSAVDAMRRGAADYIAKPLDHDELVLLIGQLAGSARKDRPTGGGLGDLVGHSPAMTEVYTRIRRAAATGSTVLILGESGTGTELVARTLHVLGRPGTPFVTVNGTTFTPAAALAASEGTLFLDEVGDLSLSAQAELLQVLQDSSRARVRFVAASHRDLPRMVADRTLRADLYFRLRVVDMILPPLRDRGDDVEEIALALLERADPRRRRVLGPDALTAIRAHRWPGNVRERASALERALVLTDDEVVRPEHLGLPAQPRRAGTGTATGTPDSHEDLSLAAYFKRFVLTHQGHLNESELAAKLGISRKTLWERRLRYSLPRQRPPQ